MAWKPRVQPRGRKNDFENGGEKPRGYTRADRSARRPEGRRSAQAGRARGARRGTVRARPLRAPVKSARARAPSPGIFPDFQFICRDRARMWAQWEGNDRERFADRYRPCTPLPKWHGQRSTVFIEFFHRKAPMKYEGGREGCISLKRRRDGVFSRDREISTIKAVIDFGWNNNFVGQNEWNRESCRKRMVILLLWVCIIIIILLEENCWKGNIG